MAIGARNKVGASGRARREAFVNALAGVTEAAYLAAAADGVVTEEEYTQIANLIVERCEGNVTLRAVGDILQACVESLDEEGFEARMNQIADTLPDAEAQVAALYAASDVILGDDEYDPENEGAFYDDLATRLGFSDELAAEIWNNQLATWGWT